MLAKIAADRDSKNEATAGTLIQGWRLTCTDIEKESSATVRYQRAKAYLSTLNTDLKRNTLESEVRLYMLNALLTPWLQS